MDAASQHVMARVNAPPASDSSEKPGDGVHPIKRLWMMDPDYTHSKFNEPVVNGG